MWYYFPGLSDEPSYIREIYETWKKMNKSFGHSSVTDCNSDDFHIYNVLHSSC